jgi:hypothetical protein
MLGTFLQAIIAIISIYLILALLTSELQEYVATLFEARARRLKQSIFKMLGEEDWLHQYFIDDNQLKIYQGTEVIAPESKVWLQNQNIIKVKDSNQIFSDSAGKDSIWIDSANQEEVSNTNVIVSSSDPNQGQKATQLTLDRFNVLTTAQDIGANCSAWLKDRTLTLILDNSKIVTDINNGGKCIWIDNNTELTNDPANPVGTSYPVFTSTSTDPILKDSKVWLQDQNIIKVQDPPNQVFLNSAGQESIWIDSANQEEVSNTNVIVSSNNPDRGQKATLDRFNVLTTAQDIGANCSAWLKDRTLTLILDNSKIVTDSNNGGKCIWIDSNNAELTNDPENPVGTSYPVFTSTSTDPILKDSKVWLQDQNIIKVQDPSQVFLNSAKQESIWIDKVNNNTVINTAEVEQDQGNTDKGANKNSSLTKFPIYQVLVDFKAQTQYLLDETRKVLLTPDSLTEKLYEHPDIRALNQSDFRWFWILGISFTDYPSWKFSWKLWEFCKGWKIEDWYNFALTIILLLFVICLFFQVPIIFQMALFVTFVIVRGISFLKSKKTKGKFSSRRKSYGPSYIEDPKLFADTLIGTIKQNSTEKSENLAKPIMGKMTFYTPAQSVLLQKVTDSTDLQSFTELLKIEYQAVQERSTGVYKRNAKGLSFVIGLLIAILLNADTFNMIANLTKEGNDVGEKIVNELVKNPGLIECAPGQKDCITNDQAKQKQLKTAIDQVGLLPLGWDYWDKLNLEERKAKLDELDKYINGNENLLTLLNNEEISKLCKNPDNKGVNPDNKGVKDCFEKVDAVIFNNLQAVVPYLNEKFVSGFKDAKADPAKISSFPAIYNNFLTGKAEELSKKKIEKQSFLLDTTANQTSASQKQTPSAQGNFSQEKEKIEKTVQKQGGWFKVIFGWLITAIALGMGAPFWFDLLGKVMNVRNAGTFNSSEQTNPPPSKPPGQQ